MEADMKELQKDMNGEISARDQEWKRNAKLYEKDKDYEISEERHDRTPMRRSRCRCEKSMSGSVECLKAGSSELSRGIEKVVDRVTKSGCVVADVLFPQGSLDNDMIFAKYVLTNLETSSIQECFVQDTIYNNRHYADTACRPRNLFV